MSTTLRARRVPLAAAGAALAAAIVVGCTKDKELVMATPPVNALFASYVAIGNSITAGYQSSGINDSTQKESYARLLALQMGTRYAYPSLAMPGCPPPVQNFQTQGRVGGGTDQTCLVRNPASVSAILNNVAVPGATVADPTSTSTSASNALTTLFLGGTTQAALAQKANPTFVSIWAGNNDVLEAAVSGLLVATPGVSRGVTAQTAFESSYNDLLAALAQPGTLKGGVLIGVVDVRNIPILFPVAALFNPAFKAGFDQFAGATTTIHPSCTPTTTALISFRIVSEIRKYVATSGASGHPPLIVCAKNQAGIPAPVGDIFVLDAAELTQLGTAVTAYNTFIQGKATANGFAYFDPNPSLAALKAANAIPTVPILSDTFNTFGTFISLDGVHPRKPAHVLIADSLIATINKKYNTAIPLVP